ncbi:putative nuclease HARBI1 [Dermacentor albipictus]|uniref:putative nuclease HARBI1 n=1 Tax=Dermacentor albipictus TaxID=60249 RepID=UPI0038FBF7AF
MPDDLFRRHFRLKEETEQWLCDEGVEELGGVRAAALSVERQVLCALRFFATGSFQGSVGSEETTGETQPAVSKCVRHEAEAIVRDGARNKWVLFPRTSEEKAALKEGFLRRGAIPDVIRCVVGSLIAIVAPKSEQKAAFTRRKGYYAFNTMLICDAGMRILAVETLRPRSDHDVYVWRTTWLRHRFQERHIAKVGEHLLRDDVSDDVNDDSSNSSSDDDNGDSFPQGVPRGYCITSRHSLHLREAARCYGRPAVAPR